jgi:hypothetical protein
MTEAYPEGDAWGGGLSTISFQHLLSNPTISLLKPMMIPGIINSYFWQSKDYAIS